jgi:hypothetical protein
MDGIVGPAHKQQDERRVALYAVENVGIKLQEQKVL